MSNLNLLNQVLPNLHRQSIFIYFLINFLKPLREMFFLTFTERYHKFSTEIEDTFATVINQIKECNHFYYKKVMTVSLAKLTFS